VLLSLFLLLIASIAYIERLFIAYTQLRLGSKIGFLQFFADMIKLSQKTVVFPKKSYRSLFLLGPCIVLMAALAILFILPFTLSFVLLDIELGIFYILLMNGIGSIGLLFSGMGSHSKYAFLGSIRLIAKMLAYEIPLGLIFIGILMKTQSTDLTQIVLAQSGGLLQWNGVHLFPLLWIYCVCNLARLHHSSFDVQQSKTDIMTGIHIEYSGLLLVFFWFAKYINLLSLSVLTSILFLGGWLSPFEHLSVFNELTYWIPSFFWLLLKSLIVFIFFFLMRITLSRFRYDQLIRLAWKTWIPLIFIWLIWIYIRL
jgi:NADH-quinone oxidoreductase subunit H